MDEKNLEHKILGIALNETITFEIVIDHPSFIEKILKRKKRKYEVRRYTTLAQNMKLTKSLIEIPPMDYEGKSDSEILQLNFDFIAKYSDKIVEIIGYVLGEKDLKFIKRNLSNRDLFSVIVEIIPLMDIQSFMTTITLMRNKVSLKNGK